MKQTLPILILSALLFLLLSCMIEDDAKKLTGPSTPDITNSSPDSLIMAFEEAYSSRDSSAYATLLDSAYTFWNLEEEIDGVWYPGEWWDLDEELTIGGRMFSGWANESGANVQSISLNLHISSNTVDTTAYPGKPEGETWYRIITSVDMIIVVDDPESCDGIMNYIVLCNQIFVVRPDPANEGLWVIYRQEDQHFANKGGTENFSCGSVKSLFRGSMTKDASWGEVKNLFR